MTPVALINGPFFHHLDHLAPLSVLIKCPLIVDDETTYEIAKKYYPDVDVHLQAIDLINLSNQYNLLLVSTRYAKEELQKAFNALGVDHIRFCYCPHGKSDKGLVSNEGKSITGQDIALLYSPSQKTLLQEDDAKETHVIGNYRAHYYMQYKEALDTIVEEEIFSQFGKTQKTLLYAPTWADNENSTTFFTHYKNLIDSLESDQNLIIKLHPLLEKHHPAYAHHALSYHLSKPNIQVLLEFPLIYPLLNRIDAYLGDYSAIGYDFLYFDRPLYFLADVKLPLHDAGISLKDPKEAFFPHKDSHSTIRKTLYDKAFSPFNPVFCKFS